MLVVVLLVVTSMVGQLPVAYEDSSELRLWLPWAMFHSGTETDGSAMLLPGNPAFYLAYLLCLCAGAALVAIWHDRASRTGQLRFAVAAVAVVGLACLALAVTTGPEVPVSSEPIPYKVSD